MANNIFDPKNVDIGELNPEIKRDRRNPDLSDYENNRRQKDDRANPDTTKNLSGERIGIALENSFEISASSDITLPEYEYENTAKLIALRVRVVEEDRVPHPDEILTTDDGKEVSEKLMLLMHPVYIANSSDVKQKPNKGDLVRVNVHTKRYLGLHMKSSINAGKNSRKQSVQTQSAKPSLGLRDTTSPPAISNPLPQQIVQQRRPKTPDLYQIYESGKTRPPDDLEMDFIPGTQKLFPKKYMNAINELRKAYQQETGQVLGITSAFRDVESQTVEYDKFIARNKTPPVVAVPGNSKHNSGKAVDFATGNIFNDTFTNSGLKVSKKLSYENAASGNFGPVAKWLSLNSERFGFYWAGYSIGELWHYEFDPNSARQKGLIE